MIVTFHVSSSGPPTYRDTFRCRPEHTPAVRGLVRTALAVWRLDGLVGDAELVVTELASNAIRHTGSGEIGITVVRLAERLVRITVRDECDAFPVFRSPRVGGAGGVGGESGYGLTLVDRVTCRWGVNRTRPGKEVWGELGEAGL